MTSLVVPWSKEPLEFPDDWTPDQINEALPSHPNYPKDGSADPPYNFMDDLEKPSDNSFVQAAKTGAKNTALGIGEAVKGIPIAGRAIEDSRLDKFEKEHPNWSTGLQIAGGIGGTIPAMAMLPEVGGAGLGGFLLKSLMRGTANTGINVGDTAAKKGIGNVTASDVGHDAAWGYGTGVVGEGLSKAISPNAIPRPKNIPAPAPSATPASVTASHIMDDLGEELPYDRAKKMADLVNKDEMESWSAKEMQKQAKYKSEVFKQKQGYDRKVDSVVDKPQSAFNQLLHNGLAAGAGGLGASALGFSPLMGAIAGPFVREYAGKAVKPISRFLHTNQIMGSPTAQRILGALGANVGAAHSAN